MRLLGFHQILNGNHMKFCPKIQNKEKNMEKTEPFGPRRSVAMEGEPLRRWP